MRYDQKPEAVPPRIVLEAERQNVTAALVWQVAELVEQQRIANLIALMNSKLESSGGETVGTSKEGVLKIRALVWEGLNLS